MTRDLQNHVPRGLLVRVIQYVDLRERERDGEKYGETTRAGHVWCLLMKKATNSKYKLTIG